MKKGSITVFLSLVLVLVFSFLLTTLEAARIRGATAYVSMITDLAGDSFLASYYYPLFQNYRIFGVDAGDQKGFFSREKTVTGMEENLAFGLTDNMGGLLKFKETEAELLQYTTLMENDCEAFFAQIKQQVVLDGFALGLDNLFSEEQFTEAGVVGEIYREQEEALAATATVTEEIVKLMELTDGIRMGDNGIAFDKNGRMQAEEHFIKQPVSMTQAELLNYYGNEEVYNTVSGRFIRMDKEAEQLAGLLTKVQRLDRSIAQAEENIEDYRQKILELQTEYEEEKKRLEEEQDTDNTLLPALEEELLETAFLIEEEENGKYEDESERRWLLSLAEAGYETLENTIDGVQKVLEEAIKVTERLEKKQVAAKLAVEAYEVFLEGIKEKFSAELYDVFAKELEKMKLYAGLDESGFSLSVIKRSIQSNKALLEALSLPRFSSRNVSGMIGALSAIKDRMGEYTVEGLWFSYGEIVVAEQTFQNITGFLAELMTTGVLSLVGVSEEELSDRRISGKDLPSAGLEEERFFEELMGYLGEVQELFRSGGIGEVLLTAGNAALNGTALELYSMKYFRCFGEDSPYSRLNYEREYLIFGKDEDKNNLLSMVLYLMAIRTLLNMVMILKHPDRMLQLESLSAGVAGFTGMPGLAAAAKYSVLLLWSAEEALVDTSALLQGKRIAVVGPGRVSFQELFLINKAAVERKATMCIDGTGAAYTDYLALVSLTKQTKVKAYRALDLIQENIRLRYRDNFRIRNLVTGITFQSLAKLQPLFDAGIFEPAVYEMKKEKEAAY